jgi:GNAT superfamily N-acetyltransferase
VTATINPRRRGTAVRRQTVRIVTAGPSDIPAGIDLVAERYQHFDRGDLAVPHTTSKLFPQHQMLEAVDSRGRAVAVAEWFHPAYFPDGWVAIRIAVAQEWEGHDVGSALKRSVLEAVPAGTTKVSSVVSDDDARSLSVAGHWGFTVAAHPIQSEYPLPGAAVPPSPPEGVPVDDCSNLQFTDRDEVDAMIIASDTSPEGRAGMRMDLEMLSAAADTTPTPCGVLARVRGVPAGICFGAIEDRALKITYTGVQPRFRGRGLGRLLKEVAHTQARDKGADRSVTFNDASNTAIRRINAGLGYVVQFGYFRVSRALAPEPR